MGYARTTSGLLHNGANRRFVLFFFSSRRRHTRCLSDWSSDVCSSDLYPDVIESISVKGPSQTIKSHHNVGGLPERMHLKVVEPLRELFKDEVRRVGLELGLPEDMVWRQPFPGPGLAVRIMGEITREGIRMLQEADDILVSEIKKAGLYRQIWQSFGVLLPVKSVGVMGDIRTYEHTLAIRAVHSADRKSVV